MATNILALMRGSREAKGGNLMEERRLEGSDTGD
jgi:hypothetical protein